jgi:formylglycine-generating enzyme required for sulfatase activity
MTSVETTASDAPSRLPIYLSALLIPGAGQFLQRRWLPAFFFSISFLFFFVFLVVEVGRCVISVIQSTLAFMQGDPDRPYINLCSRKVLLPLGLSLIIYIMGLCDTYLAYLRECRAWGERRMEEKLKSLMSLLLIFFFPALLFAEEEIPTAPFGLGPPPRLGELHQAITANDLLKVDALLDRCGTGEVNTVVSSGITPLHLAAALNQKAVVGMLIAKGAVLEAQTGSGFTPLHWAAGKDALDASVLLIRLGADVRAQAVRGITPLHWAAGKNATNVVKLLVASGADVQAKTESGLTPLHWAVRNNANEAAVLLAFKTVSDQMDSAPPVLEEKTDTEEAAATEPVERPPAVGPRPVFGKSLIVALGRGEELTFIWIRDLKLWAGKHEITNGQYRRFRAKHDSRFRENFSLNRNDQPVVYVSWNDAKAFCNWLNNTFSDRLPQGCEFRLPLEAEWILMAKAGDNRKYPWGNSWPPKYGNYSDLATRKGLTEWQGISGYEDGHVVTCPVADSGSNEWGIYGLAGNVWEWCDDWFDADKKYRVRHGASWDFDEKPSLAILFRGFDRPEVKDDTIGIRLVVSPK